VLKRFAFDQIKIDRAFVNELADSSAEARAIARAVVRFAASLGKTTTAEGVETKEQLDMLLAEGCAEAQGFYFSPPRQVSQIRQLAFGRIEAAA
jgi:EAL domain-containing protein (putative c-di-GMP-specific phosphodiesterase class I)